LPAVTGLSAAFGLALTFATLPATAQQSTTRQRAACEPHAMRLCDQYVPDVQRAHKSLGKKKPKKSRRKVR
jgi:hypothetical protein